MPSTPASSAVPPVSVRTFLWFESAGEEAANLYVSLLPGSRIVDVFRTERKPGEGLTALTVDFELGGQKYTALNGGPHYKLTPACSIAVTVETQAEVDRLWDALLADGGEPSQCGWLTDRFGVSWQIIPTALPRLLGHPDKAAAGRAMKAMMGMVKLDIATLEAAAAG